MPGTLIFLTNVRDPTDPATTFGQGHVTDFDVEDDAWVKVLWSEGKVAILSTTDVPLLGQEQARQEEQLEPPHVWPGLIRSTTG